MKPRKTGEPVTNSHPEEASAFTANELIRLDEVLERLISKSTWWDGVRTGKYPTPVKLGDRITCWRLEDVLELVDKGAQ